MGRFGGVWHENAEEGGPIENLSGGGMRRHIVATTGIDVPSAGRRLELGAAFVMIGFALVLALSRMDSSNAISVSDAILSER